MYQREIYHSLLKRLQERRRKIQVLVGPRQTGKTTLIQQILKHFEGKSLYASAEWAVLEFLSKSF